MKTIVTLFAAIFISFSFTSCATWQGIKKDSSSAWESTKETSEEVYDSVKESLSSKEEN